MADHHRADLIVILEPCDDPDIRLRDDSLSDMTALRAFSRIYGFHYSHRRLSVNFHTEMSPNNVTKSSPSALAADRPILNSGAVLLFLDGSNHVEAMLQLHRKGVVGWTQQNYGLFHCMRKQSGNQRG